MTKKLPIPRPIFDTLENLESDSTPPFLSKHELNLAFDFLKQYDGNKSTFNCYRREMERLIQWACLIQKKSILDLRRVDIESYINFCIKPPKSWIAPQVFYRFKTINGHRVPNPRWRPFVLNSSKSIADEGKSYKVSQKSIQEIFVALGSFYSFLNAENHIEHNPILAIKQKSKFIKKNQNKSSVRRLSDLQWKTVCNVAKDMASDIPEVHERTLFIISTMYLMYLRVSELVSTERWSPQMNHFYQDSYKNWWFKTVGKGNKERSIAVNDDMIEALKRWRAYLKLVPALPTRNDDSPLIAKLRGSGNITNPKVVYNIVKKCFAIAIERLHNINEHEEANNLTAASSHWLRHTGISDSINKFDRPIAHVRDDAGHASINTTDRYNDINMLERHNSAKKGKLEHS